MNVLDALEDHFPTPEPVVEPKVVEPVQEPEPVDFSTSVIDDLDTLIKKGSS